MHRLPDSKIIEMLKSEGSRNFTDINFTGFSFFNYNLSKVLFSNCDFTNADLSGAILKETCFFQCALETVKFPEPSYELKPGRFYINSGDKVVFVTKVESQRSFDVYTGNGKKIKAIPYWCIFDMTPLCDSSA